MSGERGFKKTKQQVFADRRGRRIQKSAANYLEKVLASPERVRQEQVFAQSHAGDSDEMLYNYIKAEKKRLGKRMKPGNTIGYVYLTKRLGKWSVLMGRVNSELKAETALERSER